jgi:hypothetical protein
MQFLKRTGPSDCTIEVIHNFKILVLVAIFSKSLSSHNLNKFALIASFRYVCFKMAKKDVLAWHRFEKLALGALFYRIEFILSNIDLNGKTAFFPTLQFEN